MKCSYKDLVAYLAILEDELPAYTNIDRLEIIKDGAGPSQLGIALDINLYLLS